MKNYRQGCNLVSGTKVHLFGVPDLPDNTEGIIDFIDDVGFIFIETPAKYKNVRLSPSEAVTKIKKE